MENKELKTRELQEWAKSIINYCSPIAEKENLEYYPLQSPLNTYNTEVLIVGINPRNNGNYKSQNENEQWEFIDGRMTPDRLLKGNPYFTLDDPKWGFFKTKKNRFFEEYF